MTRLPSAALEDAFLGSVAAAVGALEVSRVAGSIRLAFEIEGRMVDEVRGRAAGIFKNALGAAAHNHAVPCGIGALGAAVVAGDVPATFGWQVSVSVEPAAALSTDRAG